MEKQICPILSNNGENGHVLCKEDDCAWFCGICAVLSIAMELNNNFDEEGIPEQ